MEETEIVFVVVFHDGGQEVSAVFSRREDAEQYISSADDVGPGDYFYIEEAPLYVHGRTLELPYGGTSQ